MASLDCLSNFVVLSEYSEKSWAYQISGGHIQSFLQFKVKVQLLSMSHIDL